VGFGIFDKDAAAFAGDLIAAGDFLGRDALAFT
jgi:hypothetical protein